MKKLSDEQLLQLQTYLQGINTILGLTPSNASVPQPMASIFQPSIPKKRKIPSPRFTSATFRYRWLDTHPQLLIRLYQHLLRAQWIAPDTKPDDFCALFEGMESPCKIRWTGSAMQLAYLIRILTERQYISLPTGIGKWTCVYSHFVNRNGRTFTGFNSLHIPLKSRQAIEQLAHLLCPDSVRQHHQRQ